MVSRVFVAAAVLTICMLSAGHAQEFIGIFDDTDGCPCEIRDTAAGLGLIVVLHVNSDGALASRFSTPRPACFQAVYIQDQPVFPMTVGNSQTGVQIAYDHCRNGTFQILTMAYLLQGLTWECCSYPVLPDPAAPSGQIEIADCNNQTSFAPPLYDEVINANSNCICIAGPDYCYPVAVADATWGKIKALYE